MKRKMFNKLMALLMAGAMTLSSAPVTAQAAYAREVTEDSIIADENAEDAAAGEGDMIDLTEDKENVGETGLIDFSEEEEHISSGVVHPYVFEEELENCRKIKIGVEISNTDGDPFGEFGFWVRSDGEWKRVGTMDIDEEDKLYINTFVIDPALSIDALTIMPTGEFDHDVTWANSFYFYEAQVE